MYISTNSAPFPLNTEYLFMSKGIHAITSKHQMYSFCMDLTKGCSRCSRVFICGRNFVEYSTLTVSIGHDFICNLTSPSYFLKYIVYSHPTTTYLYFWHQRKWVPIGSLVLFVILNQKMIGLIRTGSTNPLPLSFQYKNEDKIG